MSALEDLKEIYAEELKDLWSANDQMKKVLKKITAKARDIIAQYQQMTHYGIAGFGTAAAYAQALGLKGDNKKLSQATKEIYGGDEYMTKLAETSVNLQALSSVPLR